MKIKEGYYQYNFRDSSKYKILTDILPKELIGKKIQITIEELDVNNTDLEKVEVFAIDIGLTKEQFIKDAVNEKMCRIVEERKGE